MKLDPVAVVILVNAMLVSAALVGVGAWLAGGELSVTEPSARQNMGEYVLEFFVGKAREMAHGEKREKILGAVAPMLATFFLFIIVSNFIAMLPIPIINRPPTANYSATLALALSAVLGTMVVSVIVNGWGKALMHLVWPNPLQWVSELTDVLSLSLRLFGNIAGEYMTVALVMIAVPWGIPLILHALGLIPAFVQALVFTLLTASFLSDVLHHTESRQEQEAPALSESQPAMLPGPSIAEGRS
jgi:F-type H+-transporting ATPase subunit a